MCGILGVVNVDREPVDPDVLVRMRDSMVHRGPDDEGIWAEDGAGLGHLRLAIIDLSPAGHQPMTIDEGDLWLTFNGEIYNYVELTKDLEARGHQFHSKSDTECILRLYREYGTDCLQHLNGMFAFAIWDRKKRTLFAARDRMGIKPFHYMWTGKRLVFASEIKAILEYPGVRREADLRGIADYIFAGRPLAGRTFFANIGELERGEALLLEGDSLKTWSYWGLEYAYDSSRSDEDLVDEVAELIDDAVMIHCRSDATLGCHLSGGLDSSTVAMLTAKHRGPVKSFSIRTPGGAFFDETPYAKAVSKKAGTEYTEDVADVAHLARSTPKLIWHLDQPIGTPGFVNYYSVSRLAAQHVKVSLTGHGGDEVFAGYPAQFQMAFGSMDMFDQSEQPADPEPTISYRLRNLLRNEGVAGVVDRLRRRAAPSDPLSPEQQWVRLHCGTLPSANPHSHPDFITGLGGYSPVTDYLTDFTDAPTDEMLDRCLHHDLRNYLPSLLHMEDRASMAVSLESRVPLLDYRIAELLATVPPEQKVRDREPKRLLRKAGERWLPDEILARRDKAGFAMPVPKWLGGELADDVRRILCSKPSLERGIFDPRVLGDRNFFVTDGWKALSIEIWFRIFIDGDLDPETPMWEIA